MHIHYFLGTPPFPILTQRFTTRNTSFYEEENDVLFIAKQHVSSLPIDIISAYKQKQAS